MPLTLEQRRANHKKVSEKLAEMSDEEVVKMLQDSPRVHAGIGGTAVKLEIEEVPIFAKCISLTDFEMEHSGSTKNIFDLPTYYQYGIGSAGFGANREVVAHQMTSDWVLSGECPNFPLLYGQRIVAKTKAPELNEEQKDLLDAGQEYWGKSQAVRNRLEAIENSSHSVVVFLESIPQNLSHYLFSEEVAGRHAKRRNVEMVEREIRSTTAFMESKGMIHFDGHNKNILTDGEQIYFSDFGLATSLDFELSDEEREFFEKNRGYDLALGLDAISRESRAQTPEVLALAKRHKLISEYMQQFQKTLRKDPTKLTEFPAEEMRELCKMKIALITPGVRGDLAGSKIEQDAEKLKSLGFRTEFLPDSVSNFYPFVGAEIANTAEQRARQIINFAQDSKLVAMWAVHGGESCPEVAKLLVEYGKNPQKYLKEHQLDCISGETLEYAAGAENGFPKDRALPTIVGMSDVSNIQLALAQFGFPSHYGHTTLQDVNLLRQAAESLQSGGISEFDQITQVARHDSPEQIRGTVYATVSGGLESSLYTDWQPKFPPNTVLMIEGVSGYDAITSALGEAKQAGALTNVSAILVGNPVHAGKEISPESAERFNQFAEDYDIPIFSVGGNQFGHLREKEPTPIANFGTITIDVAQGTARIEQAFVQENIKKFRAEKTVAQKISVVAPDLQIDPPALRLTGINHSIPDELTDVIGCEWHNLPRHLDLEGKTLLVDYDNWVALGRQMTDFANRGALDKLKAIVFSIDNYYPGLKSRFDSASSDEEKVAVGLSFATHQDFKFTHEGGDRYRCGNCPKQLADVFFTSRLKDLELKAEDILEDAHGITLPIPAEKNAEIIALISDAKGIGRVKQSAGRAEYFAKQHPEILVFLNDRAELPEAMRGELFSAERLEVRNERIPPSNSPQSRSGSFVDAAKVEKEKSSQEQNEH